MKRRRLGSNSSHSRRALSFLLSTPQKIMLTDIAKRAVPSARVKIQTTILAMWINKSRVCNVLLVNANHDYKHTAPSTCTSSHVCFFSLKNLFLPLQYFYQKKKKIISFKFVVKFLKSFLLFSIFIIYQFFRFLNSPFVWKLFSAFLFF